MKNLLWTLLLLIPSLLFAEPYLALREGLKCSSCHMNQTGGGKRTKFGAGFGAQDLPWKKVDLVQKNIPHYWSLRDDLISIGGDFRLLNDSNFTEDKTTNTFQTDKSNLYLSVRLLPDRLTFYLDESVAPGGAQAREIFALLNLPARGWVKAGKFVLPYGIRLEDDRAFLREITGFNFNNPDIGAEVGFEPGNWTVVASFTNGTAGSLDDNTNKQLIGSVAYVWDQFRLGGSASYNPGPSGDKNSAALWSGLRLGPVVLLGEIDFVRDASDPQRKHDQVITYSEINFRVHEGWNVKAAYEFFDPDTDIEENERDRFLIGVEPFVMPFLQFQVFYRFNQSIPQNKAQNADELTFRVHIYF